MNMRWRALPELNLHARAWDDEFVVYNSLSGDTHLLGSAAAQILLMLQQAPSDAIALAESLAPRLQLESELDEELAEQITHLLSDLHTLALIEPIRL
ncbi:MAG: HPr-rel-A system PqqD family peptide chaperone [Pseudomonadota bacterium]